MGEIDLNQYMKIDLSTGEVIDKYQENVTALTVGAQGLVGSIQTPAINLSGSGAEYTPVGELDLDTKFDINKFQVPQYEIANYFDGQGLPALPKKEGYKESEKIKDYTDEYLNGVQQTIVVDSNNVEQFYNFQKEQYDVAMEYFKNEVSSIDFNYATSPEQVGQAILSVLVDMEQQDMFQFTTHAQGPDFYVPSHSRASAGMGSFGGYNFSDWYDDNGNPDNAWASPFGVSTEFSGSNSNNADRYQAGYKLKPSIFTTSEALKELFDQGETFGGYVQTGNEQDFVNIANAVYKPINKVVIIMVV
jgi:hypothetical protein